MLKQAVPIVSNKGVPNGGATTCAVRFLELVDHGGWVFDRLPVGATKLLFEIVPQQAPAASSAAPASAASVAAAAPVRAKKAKAVASPARTQSTRASTKMAPAALDAAGSARAEVVAVALAIAPPPLSVLVHMLEVLLVLSKRVACPAPALLNSALSVLAFVARTRVAARDVAADEARDTRTSSRSSARSSARSSSFASSRSHSPEGGARAPRPPSAPAAFRGGLAAEGAPSEAVLQYLALGAMGVVRAQARGEGLDEMLRRGVLWLLLPLIAAPSALARVALDTALDLVARDTARGRAGDEGGEGDAPRTATAAHALAEMLPLSLVALLEREAPLALRVLQCPADDHEELSPEVALNIMWTERMMAEAMDECAYHCDTTLASRGAAGGASADAAAAGGAVGFRAGKGYQELEGGLILGGVVVRRLLAWSSLIARIADSATATDVNSPGFFDTMKFVDGALAFMCRAAASPPPTTPTTTTPRAAGGSISEKAWALVDRERRAPQTPHAVDLIATARCAERLFFCLLAILFFVSCILCLPVFFLFAPRCAAQCVLLLVEGVPRAREACCARNAILRLFALLELLSAGAY